MISIPAVSDAWVGAIALRCGLKVELEGIFTMSVADGRCRILRHASVADIVALSSEDLRIRTGSSLVISQAIIHAYRDLYSGIDSDRPYECVACSNDPEVRMACHTCWGWGRTSAPAICEHDLRPLRKTGRSLWIWKCDRCGFLREVDSS